MGICVKNGCTRSTATTSVLCDLHRAAAPSPIAERDAEMEAIWRDRLVPPPERDRPLRAQPSDSDEQRASVAIRRSVLQSIALGDALDHHATARQHHASAGTTETAYERITARTEAFARASADLELELAEERDARSIYVRAWDAEMKRLTNPTAVPRAATAHDLQRARIREHLTELIARAWVAGARAELEIFSSAEPERRQPDRTRRDEAVQAAPQMVEGALDAIMQVLA